MSETHLGDTIRSEAFIVRGHHATRLYNVLAIGMSIDDVISQAEEAPAPYKGYKADVWGTTPEETAIVTKGVREFITNFLELPDKARVRFVAGQKDAICGSCAIGQHCETLSPKGDKRFLATISRLARDGGMEEDLVEGEVVIAGREKPSPVVDLSAWAAKRILSNLDFHAQTYPKFFRPFARAAAHSKMKSTV